VMDEATHGALTAGLPVPISEEEMALQYLNTFALAAGNSVAAGGAQSSRRRILPIRPEQNTEAPGSLVRSKRKNAVC
jgi:hypothetical protein